MNQVLNLLQVWKTLQLIQGGIDIRRVFPKQHKKYFHSTYFYYLKKAKIEYKRNGIVSLGRGRIRMESRRARRRTTYSN